MKISRIISPDVQFFCRRNLVSRNAHQNLRIEKQHPSILCTTSINSNIELEFTESSGGNKQNDNDPTTETLSQSQALASTNKHPTRSAKDINNLIITTFRWPSQLPGDLVSVAGSFNGWQPLPLSKMPNGDWVRSIALPPGPIQFKYIVDGEYIASPCESTVHNGRGAYNNHRLIQSTCEFSWPSSLLQDNAHDVMVAGDWSSWGELLPLSYDATTGMHSLRCCLPPGTYFYQFLVNDTWKLRPDEEAVNAPDAHFANVINVNMPPAFRIFYSTGWHDAVVKWRGLDGKGQPVTEWKTAALHDTASRATIDGVRRYWKSAVISTLLHNECHNGTTNGATEYAKGSASSEIASLEFVPQTADGTSEDRPYGNSAEGRYLCPHPGGYKLQRGKLKPFAQSCRPPVMLVSDLDGTLVGEGADADAMTASFCSYWEETAALCGSVLVYNTGRSLGQFKGLLEYKQGKLPVPDVIITAVGTKIFFLDREGGTRGTTTALSWREDRSWSQLLDKDWDLGAVRAAGQSIVQNTPHDTVHWLDQGTEHPHRIALSVHASVVDRVRVDLAEKARSRGVLCNIITSGTGDWRYVDCVSSRAGKLAALEYVRELFGVPIERCMAAGDSGNDQLMLGGRNPAVVVGNAQDELVGWALEQSQGDGRLVMADAEMAEGVLEGLARHGLY